MFKHVIAGSAALLALALAPVASAHTVAYSWYNYGWGWGFQPYHVHHSHGISHRHTHAHHGGHPHGHSHGHVMGAHHSVSASALNVRSGPSAHHHVTHVLHHGASVHIQSCHSNNWCEITHSGHHHGWVNAKYLD